MSAREPVSVSGGWLGTYAYKGAHSWQPPVRFEASFIAIDGGNQFKGTILDDSRLGMADVTGNQDGLRVRFTKVYLAPPPAGHETAPVEYEGALSEDGRQISGTWLLVVARPGGRTSRVRGVWDAHRMWSEAAAPEPLEAFEDAVSELALPALMPAGR